MHHWFVVVPLIVGERGSAGPPQAAVIQDWLVDTGNTGEAFAWRHHLLVAGIEPDMHRAGGLVRIKSVLGREVLVPIRAADLWLVSNRPDLQNTPWRINLERGIPFRDVPVLPDPHFQRPLLGLRALRRAGLKVEIDFSQDALSIWSPDLPGANP